MGRHTEHLLKACQKPTPKPKGSRTALKALYGHFCALFPSSMKFAKVQYFHFASGWLKEKLYNALIGFRCEWWVGIFLLKTVLNSNNGIYL